MGSRKADEVPGFRVVQAVQHAKKQNVADARRPPPAPSPPPKLPEKVGVRITRFGKTALPTKHEIACYSCSYVFPLAGRVQRLICPKCRITLDQDDHTIETECRDVIRTTGSVHLTSAGSLRGGDLVAQSITLEGKVISGTVRAAGVLELGGRFELDETQYKAKDLKVTTAGSVYLKHKHTFRNLDLYGALHADLEITGHATIHRGGHLTGRIAARHLVVEDGGGLSAGVEIVSGPVS